MSKNKFWKDKYVCMVSRLIKQNNIDNTSVDRYIYKKEKSRMIVNELLEKEKMSRYRLSMESGVPMTTITDICSGRAELEKCAAGTLYKIARVFGVTIIC